MKKTLYAAAALLALVGCSKEENLNNSANAGTFDLSLSVAVPSTKAVFDGNNALKFEKSDKLGAALAKADAPTEIVKVAKTDGGQATQNGAIFTIVEPDSEIPVFSGGFFDVEEKNYADFFNVYYYFPNDAFETATSPAEWKAVLKSEQKGYADHWDSTSDALIGVPGVVSPLDARYYDKWKEYSFDREITTELAHLFGFGKLTFADIPDEYGDYVVNKVKIEAVGDNKALAGKAKVDISKAATAQTYTVSSESATITVTPQEKVKVKDNVVWFVALPGKFDVKITVNTYRGDLIFERSGLEIKRGAIAAPTVHFKELDTVVSHDVTLTSRQDWTKDNFKSNYISSNDTAPYWGPDGAQMAFSLAYPGSGNSNYGTTISSAQDYNLKRQSLAYNHILGGKVILYSRAAFHNLEMVKIGLGIYTDYSPSCDYTVALVNGADTTVLKKINYTAPQSKTTDYDVFFIENTTEVKDGDLVLIVDNLSDEGITPFLGILTLNPKPELSLGVDAIKAEKDGLSGEIDCVAYATTSVPAVSVNADWITVSYAEGKLSYTVQPNEGSRRNATVTVTVVDGEYSDTKTIAVSQKSAVAVQYKLTVTPQVLKPFTESILAEDPNATSSKVEGTLTAVATGDPSKTYSVDFYADTIMLKDITDEYFQLRYDFKNKATCSLGQVEKVVVTAPSSIGTSTWGLNVGLSKEGSGSSSYVLQKNVVIEDSGSPKVSYITNDDEEYGFFRVNTGYTYTKINKIEVYFIAD